MKEAVRERNRRGQGTRLRAEILAGATAAARGQRQRGGSHPPGQSHARSASPRRRSTHISPIARPSWTRSWMTPSATSMRRSAARPRRPGPPAPARRSACGPGARPTCGSPPSGRTGTSCYSSAGTSSATTRCRSRRSAPRASSCWCPASRTASTRGSPPVTDPVRDGDCDLGRAARLRHAARTAAGLPLAGRRRDARPDRLRAGTGRLCLSPRPASSARPRRRRTAATLRSMSSSVVHQPLTLTRMARTSCQVVGPHQQVPSSWTAAITASVRSAGPNDTSTWLSTTSFSTSKPASRIPSANRRASAQLRSTSSATPSRPSEASAAHTSTPRARCEDCGVRPIPSAAAPGRYDADASIAARSFSGRGPARRRSRRSCSATCDSPSPRSQRRRCPVTWPRRSGEAAAHRPNAPSTCIHAPASRAHSISGPKGSLAPVLTFPA